MLYFFQPISRGTYLKITHEIKENIKGEIEVIWNICLVELKGGSQKIYHWTFKSEIKEFNVSEIQYNDFDVS